MFPRATANAARTVGSEKSVNPPPAKMILSGLTRMKYRIHKKNLGKNRPVNGGVRDKNVTGNLRSEGRFEKTSTGLERNTLFFWKPRAFRKSRIMPSAPPNPV